MACRRTVAPTAFSPSTMNSSVLIPPLGLRHHGRSRHIVTMQVAVLILLNDQVSPLTSSVLSW